MQSCGMSLVKYLLFAFNIIFCITGIILIVFGGIVLKGSVSTIELAEQSATYVPSILLIVAGIVIFVIAFLGCFGAIRESYGMLMTFAVFLLIIFIVELAIGIAIAVNKEELKSEVVHNTFRQDIGKSDIAKWDAIQTWFECCGVNDYTDWGGNYPKSCCTATEQTPTSVVNTRCTSIASAEMKYVYKKGCLEATKINLKKGKKIITGIGIGLAFVELIGIILACWLAAVIKREENVNKD